MKSEIIKIKRFVIIWLFIIIGFLPVFVSADTPTTVLEPTAETCDCSKAYSSACKKYCGNYQVNDVLELLVRISKIILGIVGALALLAFVVGGVMFLVSAGNKSLVERGKSTIIGAVIGLLVVFASYTIINFTAKAMGIDATKNIFNSSWF